MTNDIDEGCLERVQPRDHSRCMNNGWRLSRQPYVDTLLMGHVTS